MEAFKASALQPTFSTDAERERQAQAALFQDAGHTTLYIFRLISAFAPPPHASAIRSGSTCRTYLTMHADVYDFADGRRRRAFSPHDKESRLPEGSFFSGGI
jgi:hypothetical protein